MTESSSFRSFLFDSQFRFVLMDVEGHTPAVSFISSSIRPPCCRKVRPNQYQYVIVTVCGLHKSYTSAVGDNCVEFAVAAQRKSI
ncbi:hypothetical protein F2P81_015894 [Scophthalmus maximus]|uniref:Uncharacterized protein n=1 Tax=Scophthalmus maximus TaxID=52904 RepID=A0A6A4SFS4_SCOMX|nr:hypothetical protein F2P81_015894 [Scophthalmus maximus]